MRLILLKNFTEVNKMALNTEIAEIMNTSGRVYEVAEKVLENAI